MSVIRWLLCGIAVVWAVRRIEAQISRSTPQAVELGRQLEQIRSERHHHMARVLTLPGRGPRAPVGR